MSNAVSNAGNAVSNAVNAKILVFLVTFSYLCTVFRQEKAPSSTPKAMQQ